MPDPGVSSSWAGAALFVGALGHAVAGVIRAWRGDVRRPADPTPQRPAPQNPGAPK